MAITISDVILIAGGAGSLATIIILFVRLTWWLSKQFTEMRKLAYKLHEENNQRFFRLEMWANRRGFQPAIDPFEFDGGDPSKQRDGTRGR